MNKEQALSLVGGIRGAYGKQVTPEEVRAWWPVLEPLDADLAAAARDDLLANSTQYISPALLNQRYRELANERIQAVDQPIPPSGLSPQEYETWQRAWKAAAVAGVRDPRALDAAGRRAVGRAPAAPAVAGPRPTFGTVRPIGGEVVEGVVMDR